MSTIVENIRKLRLMENHSQAYMGKKLGMTQGNYARMENGEVTIQPDRLQKIADILGYDTEFITNFNLEDIRNFARREQKTKTRLLIEVYEEMIRDLKASVEGLKSKERLEEDEETLVDKLLEMQRQLR
jgi:transcriptional regulator with XRE-family HTH domain